MYLSDEIKAEIEYFKKLHDSFSVELGSKVVQIIQTSDEVLYMLLSASLVMDLTEDELFDNFVITDKSLTGKKETLIDAYALIDTQNTKEKQLHIFQYKLAQNDKGSASPVDVNTFVTFINNEFLHSTLITKDPENQVIDEIHDVVDKFLNHKGNKISVKCHFITNVQGINKKDEKSFDFLKRFDYDKQVHNFDVQIYGIKEIEDLAKDGKIRVGEEILSFDKDTEESYRYEDNTNKQELGLPGKVFIGMLNINELIKLQNRYHRNQLYSENIRLYLGDKGSVNHDIIETIISDKSLWFPYMNNGISIICDEMQLGFPKKDKIELTLTNMQIINGCQTVNALYSAKYSEDTKDFFNSSRVLVKVYQISKNQVNFKTAIIKATNNQNAVKSYALVSNDKIQLAIQDKLSKLDYIYDRKGEAKLNGIDKKVVFMAEAAISYKAMYEFAARQLRSGVGKGKIFKVDEYKNLFKDEYLENEDGLIHFSVKLLISSELSKLCRRYISDTAEKYLNEIPIYKKSLYYLLGLFYADNYNEIKNVEESLCSLIKEDNIHKVKNDKTLISLTDIFNNNIEKSINNFMVFYEKVNIDKLDVDNVLKNAAFYSEYKKLTSIKSVLKENGEDMNCSL